MTLHYISANCKHSNHRNFRQKNIKNYVRKNTQEISVSKFMAWTIGMHIHRIGTGGIGIPVLLVMSIVGVTIPRSVSRRHLVTTLCQVIVLEAPANWAGESV